MPTNGIDQEENQGQENPQEFSGTTFTEKSFLIWRTFSSWISNGQVASAEETPQQEQETEQKAWFTSGFLHYYFFTCQRYQHSTQIWKA